MTTIRKLNSELLKVATDKINEKDEEANKVLIGTLQAWIGKSAHLQARTDERLLLSFLRYTQFSLEESKKRIDGYYALKNIFPEVLCERSIDNALLTQLRRGIHIIPKKPLSASGPRLLISQYSKVDPKESNPREAFKLLFVLLELLALEDDHASVCGLVYVIDARDVNMEQMMQYDPYLLKKTFSLVDKCIPLRFVELHMINMRREGQAIFNFVTSFMPAKLPWKFVVHKKAEDLYDHIPREAMTVEYGGNNGYHAEAVKYWEEKLVQYTDYFAEDSKYGTDEKMRQGLNTAWAAGEMKGVTGSFRKLEVD